jgi:transcriptional regulator with XRE-family HTH domain
MPTIGETLREARMRRHLDIADVESRTKIRAKYLRALENEEFGMLPGPTFVKTFLRTYAEMLGLDPHPLLEEYRATHERRDEVDVLQPLGPQAAGRDRRRQGPRLGTGSALLLILAAVVAALVAVGLITGDDDEGTPEPTVAQTERQQGRREREQPAAPRRVRLRVTPITPTYVCVDRGAGTPVTFEDILSAPRTFRGRMLRVNLGKTDVRLRVNGRRVPLETGPNPVGFVFRPRSTRPLPPAERPCV